MLLAAVVFVSASLPGLFLEKEPWFLMPLKREQAERGLLALLLVFNAYLVYRQRELRQLRRQFLPAATPGSAGPDQPKSLAELDAVTGLYPRSAAEQRLAKEMEVALRHDRPLSLLVVNLDEFAQLNRSYGSAVGNQVLREFAQRLKAAIRGSDFAVRLSGDEFLAVLPGCPVGSVPLVVARLNPLIVDYRGQQLSLTCSAAWVDHRPGELPAELLHRADEVLHLYRNAGAEHADSVSAVR